MSENAYKKATFLKSAAKVSQLPADVGVEVAFVGYSNVGKSSTLNALTQNNKLARTSKQPGRTQLMNIFSIDDERRLIDLPGFGYAKVPGHIRQQWQQEIDNYLRSRESLCGIVLIMDIRNTLRPFEESMIEWLAECGLRCHVVLNKADKLTRNHMNKELMAIQKLLKPYDETFTVQVFSAQNKLGLDTLITTLNTWYQLTAS